MSYLAGITERVKAQDGVTLNKSYILSELRGCLSAQWRLRLNAFRVIAIANLMLAVSYITLVLDIESLRYDQ